MTLMARKYTAHDNFISFRRGNHPKNTTEQYYGATHLKLNTDLHFSTNVTGAMHLNQAAEPRNICRKQNSQQK